MLATNTSAVDGIVIEALLLAVKLSAPAALAALLVGFLASLFQTATQLQEQTISQVPKMVAVYVAIALTVMVLKDDMVAFMGRLFAMICEVR